MRWLLASLLAIKAVVGKASTLTSLEPEISALRHSQPEAIHSLQRAELAAALGFRFDRGVVALAHMPRAPDQAQWLKDLAQHEAWGLIFADAIHDPVNLGTMIRSGRCLGCDGIILGPGRPTLSRRAIRAGVGHPCAGLPYPSAMPPTVSSNSPISGQILSPVTAARHRRIYASNSR